VRLNLGGCGRILTEEGNFQCYEEGGSKKEERVGEREPVWIK
jgi:hypothetical protein